MKNLFSVAKTLGFVGLIGSVLYQNYGDSVTAQYEQYVERTAAARAEALENGDFPKSWRVDELPIVAKARAEALGCTVDVSTMVRGDRRVVSHFIGDDRDSLERSGGGLFMTFRNSDGSERGSLFYYKPDGGHAVFGAISEDSLWAEDRINITEMAAAIDAALPDANQG